MANVNPSAEPNPGLCDACGKLPIAAVLSSAMGPISFGYCETCVIAGYEPWLALVGGLFGLTSLDDVRPGLAEHIRANLRFHGKTEEELFAEVRRLEANYEEHMRTHHPEELQIS